MSRRRVGDGSGAHRAVRSPRSAITITIAISKTAAVACGF